MSRVNLPSGRGQRPGRTQDAQVALQVMARHAQWHTEAVAAAAAIHPTDLAVLDLLDQHGDLPAGRLVELTGLTSGAVTGVIDRLEASGHVERIRDPDDRRRVTVRRTATADATIDALFAPVSSALNELLQTFDDSTIAAITQYAENAADVYATDAVRIRGGDDYEPVLLRTEGPPVDTMRFVIERGLTKSALSIDPEATALIDGSFWRTTPGLREDIATVTLSYRKQVFGSIALGSVLKLHAHPAWTIDVNGGVSYCTWQLSAGSIAGITIQGGLKSIAIELPQPVGAVPFVIDGGVTETTISIPEGSAAVVRIEGGASRTLVGTHQLASAKYLKRTIGEGESATNRWEIAIRGGATKVRIA